MEDQQEIGGAQALLQLGTKVKADEEDGLIEESDHSRIIDGNNDHNDINSDVNIDQLQYDHNDLPNINLGDSHSHHQLDEDENIKATNQQINDAVEAAVMRYVGGTLGDTSPNINSRKSNQTNGKRKLNTEDVISNINEYQWDKFLEEEVDHNNHHNRDLLDNYVDNSMSPKRRRKKLDDVDVDGGIDPELSALNSTSEHEQLVQAAIMGAGELAKQLGDHESSLLNLHNLPPHQAQQVIAAATAAFQNHNNNQPDSIAAINQLAQAASSLSNKNKFSKKPAGRRVVRKDESKAINMVEPTSMEALIRDASSQACEWYNSVSSTFSDQNGARAFLQQEIDAVEHFVNGYCHLNKLSRDDVCHRVWAHERTKDSFWESLTKVLPYRSRASVYKHIKRQYHVFSVRAKWTKEDDDWLRKLAETKVGNWKEIGETMGRMPEDCRDRWRNYVKCGDNRLSNKWSEAEEMMLRNIVMEMLSTGTKDNSAPINWTLVSERMNGQRSRIQCRYKWNKLLKREAVTRSKLMSLDTKLWLFHNLNGSNYTNTDSIDWNYVYQQFTQYLRNNPNEARQLNNPDFMWNANDFMLTFERSKSTIKGHKNLSLRQLLLELIDKIYGSSIASGPSEPGTALVFPLDSNSIRGLESDSTLANALPKKEPVKRAIAPKKNGESQSDVEDATSIVNAAVAAVSAVNEQDTQQQEYSLWR